MSAAGSPAPIADAELAVLQAAMLRSALRGAPLPGGDVALPLPDRALLTHAGPALLLDEGLAPRLAEALPHDVRVVSTADIAGRARTAFLRFQPPQRDGDALWLTLELRLTPGPADEQPIGLGGVQAAFRRTADAAWHLAEPPRAYAT